MSYYPVINPRIRHISEENHSLKRYTHPSVRCSPIYDSQDMEAALMSTDRWMDKEDVVHTYNGIVLSHKKEWNNAICSIMDVTRDYHTKWSKSEREWQILYNITYMWNLNYDTGIVAWFTAQAAFCGDRATRARRSTGRISQLPRTAGRQLRLQGTAWGQPRCQGTAGKKYKLQRTAIRRWHQK